MVTLTFDLLTPIDRAYPRLIGSLFVQFHDDKYKEKAIIYKLLLGIINGDFFYLKLTFDLLTPISIGPAWTHGESLCEVWR